MLSGLPCGCSCAGWEGRGVGGGGQTAPQKPRPPDQREAAANWRFARAEEGSIEPGISIER